MATTRSLPWKRILGGGAAATAIMGADLRSAEACHEDPDIAGYEDAWSWGFTIGVAFGAETRFTYGFDVRRTSGQKAAIARIEARGISSLRLVLAGQAVSDHDSMVEGGLAFHTARRARSLGPSLGVHLGLGKYDGGGGYGVNGMIPFYGDIANYDVGVGVVLVPDEVKLFCASGRPLRVEDQAVLPAVARLCAEPGARDRLVDDWIRDAQAEYASIWAFERMATELAAAGAPAALVAAARASARDEARHTRLCAERAGVPFSLLPIDDEHAAPRWSRPSRAAMATLAREAWSDGCLGEGVAAAQAAEAGRVAIGAAAATQREIASDERRHAELAWSVLEWLWADGGRAARDAVADAVAQEPEAPAAAHDDEHRDALRAAGRLAAEESRAAAERELEQATARARRRFATAGRS